MPTLRRYILLSLLCLPFSAPLGAAERVLLCLGDSLTAGYGLDESQAWPALLQQRLDKELPGWRVVNAGVSGDTTAGGLKRLDWLLRAKPAAAFVCLGGNDGLRGVDVAESEANLGAILRRLKAEGATVALGGMDLPSNLGANYRNRFKAIFPRVASKEGVPLLKFMLEGVGGVPSLNQADGIHPTAEGQAIVAKTVGDFLIPLLKRSSAGATAAPEAPRVLRRRSDLKRKEAP
jgi:acyl-CoA thioesterase-1